MRSLSTELRRDRWAGKGWGRHGNTAPFPSLLTYPTWTSNESQAGHDQTEHLFPRNPPPPTSLFPVFLISVDGIVVYSVANQGIFFFN